MKQFILILCILLTTCVFAEEVIVQPNQPVNQSITPQDVAFTNCTKIFSINQEKLFYLTLASISANRFNIDEIQSAHGYIIFSANRNKYLATISKIDKTNSILKITPCNNIYNFPPGVITNTFKYIDLNVTAKI